jgi:phage terminase large subunit
MTYVMSPPPDVDAVPTLRIETARVFKPLIPPARYKGVHGGRGSGKSHFFGEQLVEKCVLEPGTNAVCIREVQKTLAGSSKRIVEGKIAKLGVGQYFNVLHDRIITPGDGVITFQGMTSHTAESIKSLEGINVAWIDEAQSLSARSLSLLLPTIRVKDSEIWASWNPTRKNDAIDDFFRGNDDHSERESPWTPPPNSVCVEANWRDNPWWYEGTLEAERLLELERFPDRYQHTYEGGYAKAFEGAYFAGLLAKAKLEKRIGIVSADPLLPIRAFHDIGGPSANADAYSIWIVQWVDQHIRVLNYYESVGQALEHHVRWMRKNGYEDAINYLPHDGVRMDGVGNRYEDHWRGAGFKVEPPIKNQGAGAATMRIEAVRRLGPKIWFNEITTEGGRDALGFYHEKKDDARGIGLGPSHDWASHGADAFGLMAICYEDPERNAGFNRVLKYANQGYC